MDPRPRSRASVARSGLALDPSLVPAGLDRMGLPLGLQLIGKPWEEGALLNVAQALEDRAGFFVEPTIIKAENDWEVVQNETFAPILYVMTFDTIDEAIAARFVDTGEDVSEAGRILPAALCRSVQRVMDASDDAIHERFP